MRIPKPLATHLQATLDEPMPSEHVDLGAIAGETNMNEELARQIEKTDGCTRESARMQIRAFKKAFENL